MPPLIPHILAYKEKEITKLYYSIGEVAQMFDVSTSLIRYWESEFDILKPKKTNKGNRLFTPADLENLRLIYHLVKENGYTLDGAKKKLRESREHTINTFRVKQTLSNLREFLVEIKSQLSES